MLYWLDWTQLDGNPIHEKNESYQKQKIRFWTKINIDTLAGDARYYAEKQASPEGKTLSNGLEVSMYFSSSLLLTEFDATSS
jgi:hypothetical protein